MDRKSVSGIWRRLIFKIARPFRMDITGMIESRARGAIKADLAKALSRPLWRLAANCDRTLQMATQEFLSTAGSFTAVTSRSCENSAPFLKGVIGWMRLETGGS